MQHRNYEEEGDMNWLHDLIKKSSSGSPSWGKTPSWISTLELNEVMKIRKQATEAIMTMEHIKSIFPTALFMTSLRDIGEIQQFGANIGFVLFYKQIDNLEKFKQMQHFTTENGINVYGYARSNGFDETFYQLNEDKWIPVETDNWVFGTGEGIRNLVGLILSNTIENAVDPELMWRRYSILPNVQKAFKYIMDNNISIKDGYKIIEKALPSGMNPQHTSAFLRAYNVWWWSHKSADEFHETLSKAIDEFESQVAEEQSNAKPSEDPYVYNISMDPKTQGVGKFIDMELAKQAFDIYGDFNITIRYQMGRLDYPVSQIVGFFNSPDDDMSFNFFNQLNGIRDMYISRNQ